MSLSGWDEVADDSRAPHQNDGAVIWMAGFGVD
jgi:hypothetical protein